MSRTRYAWLFAAALAGCEQRPAPAPAPSPAAPSAATTPAPASPARCEHGLPQVVCPKCTPQLAAVFQSKGDWCQEHGFPESFCPICHPDAVVPEVGAAPAGPVSERGAIEARVVRFRSPDIERTAGIETVPAERGSDTPGIECSARIAFDADALADVRAIVPGVVRKVRVELGSTVKRGAPLFDLESTQVGEIQGALQTATQRVLTAEANLARQRELMANEITSRRQVELAEQELAHAQSEVRTAEATLRMAGAARSAPSGRYTLTSPIAGNVVQRPAVVGLLATETESLATIADTSRMWALCDVPEVHASRIARGQTMTVAVEGTAVKLEGPITWIAAYVEPRTRTVTARAELPNDAGQLRANQFARATIQTDATKSAVAVPRKAVQRVEQHEVVFVRTAPGVYAPRVVQRHGDGEQVLVEGRIEAGDQVVTTGAVLLRTEVMPGSIGAGCCEVEPPRSD